jgi:gliding motility-associated-like protein
MKYLVLIISVLFAFQKQVSACDDHSITVNSTVDNGDGTWTYYITACIEPDNGSGAPNSMSVTLTNATSIVSFLPASITPPPGGTWNGAINGSNNVTWGTGAAGSGVTYCENLVITVTTTANVPTITLGDGNACSDNATPPVSCANTGTPTLSDLSTSGPFDCTDNTNSTITATDAAGNATHFTSGISMNIETDMFSDTEGTLTLVGTDGTSYSWGSSDPADGSTYMGALNDGADQIGTLVNIAGGTTFTAEMCDSYSDGTFNYVFTDIATGATTVGSFDFYATTGNCISVVMPALSGTATFSGDGITNNGDGTASFNPNGLSAGTHTITYTWDNGQGCIETVTQDVTVTCAAPCDPTWAATTVCETSGLLDLTALVTGDAGGTWSGTGVTGTNFDPTGLSGNISVTYTLPTCTEDHDFTVDAAPDPSWTTTTVCDNAGLTDLTAFVTGTSGGTWSGTGVSGTDFDPTGLSGNISLTYTVTNGTCTETSTQNIGVTNCAVCDPTWAAIALCEDAGPVDLTTLVTGDAGGTWSGTGVTGTSFDPTGLSGNITVTYTLPTCTEDHDFVVDASPDPSWTTTNICQSAGLLDLTTLVTGTAGGTWTGIGVTGTNFDPNTLSGPVAVQYQVANGLCTESSVQNITVTLIDDSSFDYPQANYCQSETDPVATNVVTIGGTFTEATGNIVFIDASTGEIDLGASTVGGPYTITYTTVGACGTSSTFDVSIDSEPDASWTTTSLCQTAGLLDLTALVTGTAGGTWTGTAVTGTDFDPSAQLGTVALTYTVINGACTQVSTQNVTVTSSGDASWTANRPFCLTEPAFDLNTLVTGDAGGSWTINGVAGSLFDAAALGAGTHTVIYSVGVNPCDDTNSQTITVEADPDPSWTPIANQCVNGALIDLNTQVTGDAGGNWSGTGMSGSMFDPTTFSVTGTTDITYTVTSATGCTADSMNTLSYVGLPDPTFTITDVCEGEVLSLTHTGTVTPTTTFNWNFGTLSGFGIGTGYYDLGSPVGGTYSVTLTVDDGGCSSAPFTASADVLPAVTASETVTQVLCNGDCTGEISMTALTGTYIGQPDYLWDNGNIGATQSALCAGTYSVLVTDDNGCNVTYEIDVIQPDPIQVDTMMVPVSCNGLSDGGAELIIIGGTPTFNVQWTDGTSGTSLTDVVEGAYDFTVQDANGCTFDGTIDVTQPDPVLDGQFATNFADQFYVNNDIYFNIVGDLGFASYNWMLNGSTVSQDSSFTYQFWETGAYTLSSIVERNGCFDTLTTSLLIDEPFNVFIPSAFSPANPDGVNDVFKPFISITNPSEYEFLIYNRWGERLFKTTDPNAAWDGLTTSGSPHQIDVYVYKLMVKGEGQESVNKVGHVALVR